jgi:hypothetical protein
MGGVVTEEQAISRAQYLDLVYSQSGTLYDLIPNAPRSSNDQTKPTPGPHADGMIGPVSTDTTGQMTGKHSQSTKATNPSSSVHTNTPSKPSSQTSEVNMVQSTACQKTHNNLEEKRRVIIIRKIKTLLSSRALKPKKTMLREKDQAKGQISLHDL